MVDNPHSDRSGTRAASRSLGALRALGRDPVLLLLLAIQGIAGLPFLFPVLIPESVRGTYSDSCADVILASVVVIAFLTCSRTSHREHQWFRLILLAGAAIWGLAEIWMWVAPDEFVISLLGDALTDGIFALGMLCLLIAAELQPDQRPSWTVGNRPFRMRLIGVVFSVSALYTYFTLAPTLSGLPDNDNWARSLLLFIPLDVFLMLRFAWLRTSTTSSGWRSIYGALALVGFTILVADVIEMVALEDWIPWIGLEPLGLIWFVPYMGLTVSARLIELQRDREHSGVEVRVSPAREIVTTEGVIVGLALAILIIHFVAPLTGILSPDLAPVRVRIALVSLSLLGCLALAQAILLGQRNRALIQDLEGINAQLLQSQKMEAVGRLAGGVAHDFNNILTVVMLNEESLRDETDPKSTAGEYVAAIGDACRRAKSLTDQLLAFSKNHLRTPTDMDLNEVIEDLSGMLQRLIGEDVRLEIQPSRRGVWISADRTQMEQLLMNLCVNARDSMPSGGHLTVQTEVESVTEKDARRFGSTAGEHVVLRVSDTGCGMSEDVLEHLFEPFFSTKDRHLGTGLGLSTVYAIVEGASGEVTVESVPDEGSTFRILLPMSSPCLRVHPPQPEQPSTPRGSGTVLLVEDDSSVRDVTRRALESYGYGVLTADGGDIALEIAQSHESKIELILTDVVMPGMSGPEVVRRAIKIRPNMRVLYMSGHTGDELVGRGVSEEGAGFIQKPFTGVQIARRIQTLLATGRRARQTHS